MSLDNGDTTDRVAPSNASPADIEKSLARIVGVRAARVVANQPGKVSEIHVLAEPGRAPKQLVRDIQSAVLTEYGLTIDYRVVSVVQLDGAPAATVTEITTPRAVLRRLSAETASFSTEVSVGVAVGGEELDRTMRGPATAGLRLIAEATVDAVGSTLRADAVEIESVEISKVGNRQAALVVLKVITSRGDHAVCGSALVRRDPIDAVARATLDALNRFIGST